MWNAGDNRTRIKLCQFDYLEAAHEASSMGADALGFHVLSGNTKDWRDRAHYFRSLLEVLPALIEKVLLVDYPPEVVIQILAIAPFDTVQLYPDWDPDEIRRVRSSRDRVVNILKVMSAQEHENIPSSPRAFLDRYADSVDGILLDSYRIGGTGLLADAEYCAKIVAMSPVPVFIAGGLTADNVGDRIRTIRPFGVDVESGVSDRLGDGRLLKNMGKCRDFVAAVMRTDRELGRRIE